MPEHTSCFQMGCSDGCSKPKPHGVAETDPFQLFEEWFAEAKASEPVGFTWDVYDAAYYLLNHGNGNLKILQALVVSEQQLVACSISAPWDLAERIRRSVPAVLSTLTINGHQLDASSLDALPDPLAFPDYPLEATAEAP